VGTFVEFDAPKRDVTSSEANGSPLRVRLFGPMRIEAVAGARRLPQSRKLRALLGFLLLAAAPVPREQLCDLFFEGTADPRGELRWCLAKLRAALDDPWRPRVIASNDTVSIDTGDLEVDALAFKRGIGAALGEGSAARLSALLAMADGELLEGLRLGNCPRFDAWLGVQRTQVERWRAQALECLFAQTDAGSAARIELAHRRLAQDPFDTLAHRDLVDALQAAGRKAEAVEARSAALRLFARERLDPSPLRAAASSTAAPTSLAEEQSGVIPRDGRWPEPPLHQALARRAAIMVLPFAGWDAADAEIARGLAYDITFGLAKLRSLTVISRATAQALQSRIATPRDASRWLGVDYVASGALRRRQGELCIAVELTATDDGRAVWTEEFRVGQAKLLELLDTIARCIVSALDDEVQRAERDRALLAPPESLDAWQCYHRGLWHMYRFTDNENALAQRLFENAVALDPAFARAHAALSFTHFQNAFLLRPAERSAGRRRSLESAARALRADALDPAAHWAMGRALWLNGENDAAFAALDRSVALSPNYGSAHYARAFVHSQSGDPEEGLAAADMSQRLSPYDPMLFAFHAARVFSLLRLGRSEQAAEQARLVLAQPNVHVHARAIAALAFAAARREADAAAVVRSIRSVRPRYGIDQFLTAFRVGDDLEAICRAAGSRIGIR
jgi:DNA-binding SARP family transcriptional activator/TolB-like protein